MILTQLVVDASVAVKWLAPEDGSIEARRLGDRFRLIAPELVYAECANIVWKKVRRGNIQAGQAVEVIETLTKLGVEIFPHAELAPMAMDISIELDHSAYDCFYLALAFLQDCRMVTADDRLLRVLAQHRRRGLREYCVTLQSLEQ